jgi:hypothetical protein
MHIAVGTELRHTMAWQTVTSMILLLCAFSELADSGLFRKACHYLNTYGKNVRQQTSFECFRHTEPCGLSVYIKFLYTHSDSKTSIIQRQNSLLFDVSIWFLGHSGRHWNSVSSLYLENRLHHWKKRVNSTLPLLHTHSLTFQRFRVFPFFIPVPPRLKKNGMAILCSKYLITLFRHELSKHCFS